MDSEKNMPKFKISPVKKSKVFQDELADSPASPLWVPPSFSKSTLASDSRGRGFKTQKPAFLPKTSHDTESLEQSSQDPEPPAVIDGPFRKAVPSTALDLRASSAWILGVAAIVALLLFLVGWIAYRQGFMASQAHTHELRMELPKPIPAEFEKSVDAALEAYYQGDASDAVDSLVEVYRKNQTIPSTCYLLALTAIQCGNLQLASEKVDESIVKGERLSDALALKAAIQMEKSTTGGMGDPKVRAESLLRSAMAADFSNPRPYIELASLLRFQGRNDEARKLFEAARIRLNPVEGHALVETSLALLDFQQTPNNKLPSNLDPDKDTCSLISAAYIAMRKDDIIAVKDLLAKARQRLSFQLYEYLMNDPSIRAFSKNPQMAGLF